VIRYLKRFGLAYVLAIGAIFLAVMWSFPIFGPVAVLYLMEIDWWEPVGAGLGVAFGWTLADVVKDRRRRRRE
jgi:hypothetical protein